METKAMKGQICYELLTLFALLVVVRSSLIASSKVEQCSRSSEGFEPLFSSGQHCSKKFIVSLTAYNGKGESGAIYADIKFVENGSAVIQKHQLVKPFRISVTKSDVFVVYPLQFTGTTVNNQPHEWSKRVSRLHIKYHNPCNPEKHCEGDVGFCCDATHEEWIGKEYHYKRGHGKQASSFWSRGNSLAICAHNDILWYRVFSIGQPYLMYRINVTVQQLDYQRESFSSHEESAQDVWNTVGYATIGPQRVGDNTDRKKPGTTSGPQVIAEWQGDFSGNSHLPSFNTKYLLVPDWRAAGNEEGAVEAAKNHEQIRGGPNEWLVIDKHLHDLTGQSCNKIGVTPSSMLGQENRCIQKEESCFYFTPRIVYETAKSATDAKVTSHYFPTFYGDFVGIHGSSKVQSKGSVLNTVGQLFTGYSNEDENLLLIYRSHDVHKSLVTLTFTAQSISYVENRSPGRIVEALVEDFLALAGSGLLTVTAQNTGPITSDYSVSLQACTEGIIQVSEKSMTLNPRQQELFVFEISSSLNTDSQHNCTVMLTDGDGSLLDSKVVNFNTLEGCIYCPDGQCNCECKPDELQNVSGSLQCSSKNSDYMNPFWEPNIIVVGPCYHCWFTDSFKSPYTAPFCVVVVLLCFGMFKTLCVYSCCRTKNGRYFDVSSIILGTTNKEHTWKKQRSATMQFLLGVCFFVYLPLLPLMMVLCTWRRRHKARKQLKKKAKRKHHRLMLKKKAALVAMKGLMIQDGLTVDEALKVMEEGQRQPDRAAPMLPPKVLVVSSSSSDTDKHDFNYTDSSEDLELPVEKKRTAGKRVPGIAKKKKGRKVKAIANVGVIADHNPGNNTKSAKKSKAQREQYCSSKTKTSKPTKLKKFTVSELISDKKNKTSEKSKAGDAVPTKLFHRKGADSKRTIKNGGGNKTGSKGGRIKHKSHRTHKSSSESRSKSSTESTESHQNSSNGRVWENSNSDHPSQSSFGNGNSYSNDSDIDSEHDSHFSTDSDENSEDTEDDTDDKEDSNSDDSSCYDNSVYNETDHSNGSDYADYSDDNYSHSNHSYDNSHDYSTSDDDRSHAVHQHSDISGSYSDNAH